jgi:hypothetical protein
MDKLVKLPREMQAILGGSVLYLIFSFFDWQQVSAGGFTFGVNEWHGIGVVAGLLVIVLLAWEVVRFLGMKIQLGPVSPGQLSLLLALALLVFTVITFLTHSTARHWPAWIGLILSVVIAAAALKRGKAEDVHLPVPRPPSTS